MSLDVRIALSCCLHSPFFWFWLVECAALAIVVERFPAAGRLLWPVGCYFAGQLTTGLLIDRLASYRGRLVPGYRQVYLTAMGLIGVVLVTLLTIWLAGWSAAPVWPVFGWAALAFAIGCSTISIESSCLGVALIGCGVGWMTVGRPSSERVLELLGYAETGWLNVLLLLLSGWMLARLVERLWNLSEDEPTFERILRLAALMPRWRGGWSPRAGLFDRQSQLVSVQPPAFALRRRDRQLERSLLRGPGGFAWNVRRWNLAVDSRRFPQAVVMTSVVGSMVALNTGGTPFGDGVPAHLFEYAVMGVQAVLFLMIFAQYSPSPLLAFESLRPVTRENLIRQRGAGLLRYLAWCLTALAVGWGILCVFRSSAAPFGSMLAWGCVEIASLAALSALVVCLRTVRSKVLDVVVVFAGSAAAVKGSSIILGQDPRLGQPAVLYGAAITIVLAGAALFWAAYRRWLVMDLE